jgi:hypothetical protein
MLMMVMWVLLILFIGAAIYFFIDRSGLPYPMNMFAKVAVAIVCIFGILSKTGLLNGTLT